MWQSVRTLLPLCSLGAKLASTGLHLINAGAHAQPSSLGPHRAWQRAVACSYLLLPQWGQHTGKKGRTSGKVQGMRWYETIGPNIDIFSQSWPPNEVHWYWIWCFPPVLAVVSGGNQTRPRKELPPLLWGTASSQGPPGISIWSRFRQVPALLVQMDGCP